MYFVLISFYVQQVTNVRACPYERLSYCYKVLESDSGGEIYNNCTGSASPVITRNDTCADKYTVTVCVQNEGGEKVNASAVIGKPLLKIFIHFSKK